MFLLLGRPDETITFMAQSLQSFYPTKETIFQNIKDLSAEKILQLRDEELERLTIVAHSSPESIGSAKITTRFTDQIVEKIRELSKIDERLVRFLKTIEIVSCNAGTINVQKNESHAEMLAKKVIELRQDGFDDLRVKAFGNQMVDTPEQYQFGSVWVGGDGLGTFYLYPKEDDYYYKHYDVVDLQEKKNELSKELFELRAEGGSLSHEKDNLQKILAKIEVELERKKSLFEELRELNPVASAELETRKEVQNLVDKKLWIEGKLVALQERGDAIENRKKELKARRNEMEKEIPRIEAELISSGTIRVFENVDIRKTLDEEPACDFTTLVERKQCDELVAQCRAKIKEIKESSPVGIVAATKVLSPDEMDKIAFFKLCVNYLKGKEQGVFDPSYYDAYTKLTAEEKKLVDVIPNAVRSVSLEDEKKQACSM